MPWPSESKNGGTKLYASDTPIDIRFIDKEPEEYHTHFLNTEKKSVKCIGHECDYCVKGVRRDAKYSILVMDMKDGVQKSLSGSAALFRKIKLTTNLMDTDTTPCLRIKASGQKLKKEYTVVPIQNKEIKIVEPKKDEEIPF